MGEKRGMKALEAWCRRVTDGYRGVKVENMSTSWRDGLAFCALIHHFRPDLIDFDSLDKADVYRNNELAFRVAENHLGIPALLDAEDMVEYAVPDRLSILTYLSQFYQVFGGSSSAGGSPGRTVAKRPANPADCVAVAESPPSKVPAHPAACVLPVKRREPCAACGLPVFLAERLLVGGRTLYHRSCFRCARCNHPLSFANCYETEDGSYCCETCPDEVLAEDQPATVPDITDSYSADFESVLENTETPQAPPTVELARSSVARSSFMSSLMFPDDSFSEPDSEAVSRASSNRDLSQFEGQGKVDIDSESYRTSSTVLNTDAHLSTLSSKVVEVKPKNVDDIKSSVLSEDNESSSINRSSKNNISSIKDLSVDSGNLEPDPVVCTSNQLSKEANDKLTGGDVPLITSNSIIAKNSSSDSQPVTASLVLKEEETCDHNKLDNQCTKDSDTSIQSPKSLVKMRLKMFESSEDSATDSSVADKASKTDLNRRHALNRKNTDEDEEIGDKLDQERNKNNEATVGTIVMGSSIKEDSDENDKEDTDKYVPSDISEVQETIVIKDEDKDLFRKSKEITDGEIQVLDTPVSLDDKISDQVISKDTDSTPTSEKQPLTIENPDDSQNFPGQMQDETSVCPIQTNVQEYPEDLNPFGDDDEQEGNNCGGNTSIEAEATKGTSTNPFGSSDEEEEVKPESSLPPVVSKPPVVAKPPRPPLPNVQLRTEEIVHKKIIEAPKVNLNPFWSDGEEPSDEENTSAQDKSAAKTPIPLPRTVKPTPTPTPTPEPVPRRLPASLGSAVGNFGSASSLSSLCSSAGGSTARRKKKPAPPPPSVRELFPSPSPDPAHVSASSSRASSPTVGVLNHSPAATPHYRKKSRPAPPPPVPPSTEPVHHEKLEKDVANRNRQSQNIPGPESPLSPLIATSPDLSVTSPSAPPPAVRNKSMHGQWKRKKGPAPPRPIPQRRQIRAIPMQEVRRELEDIEVQQQELERQGVKLEQTIRAKFEQAEAEETTISPDVEDLVLQLFELVNEKNELFRRQAELMYLRRQQRLEEEHADLEYQIRCLLEQPEHGKTDSDKTREEELIQRLVEVVERRNEIIECLEMDRLREAEEDHSIHTQLGIFAAKTRGQEENNTDKSSKQNIKTAKKEKKSKRNKDKIGHKKVSKPIIDADKDIDESEYPTEHAKEKKTKKKWFL